MTARSTILPRWWSGPDAPESAAAPTLPDLCRRASARLDAYDAARTTALRCASTGAEAIETSRELRDLLGSSGPSLCRALEEIADHEDCGEPAATVWLRRSEWAAMGIVDASAWSIELLTLAGPPGPCPVCSGPRQHSPVLAGLTVTGQPLTGVYCPTCALAGGAVAGAERVVPTCAGEPGGTGAAPDPRDVTLETLARLLEPLALDVPRLLGALDALPMEQIGELVRLSRRAAILLDDARKALAVRDTEPPLPGDVGSPADEQDECPDHPGEACSCGTTRGRESRRR